MTSLALPVTRSGGPFFDLHCNPAPDLRMKPSLRLLALIALAVGLFAAPTLAADAAEGDPSLFDKPSYTTLGTSVVTLLIFLGLLAVLAKFAWGPIVAGLEKREQAIRADIEAAEKARADAERAKADYQEQIAGAEQQVRDLIAQANADGQQVATRIRSEAQADVEEMRERAKRDIEQSRRDALADIRTEAATMATAIAEKILRREVSAEDQKDLINASLDEFELVGNA
ncbi:MAG: F0F1 ATP synthase subunit B [Planctomycetota bacterium]